MHVLNFPLADEAELLVDRHCIEAGVDCELTRIARSQGLRLGDVPEAAGQALALKSFGDEQVKQV